MSKLAFEALSQQAVVGAGVLYFLAFLAQLAGRRVAQPAADGPSVLANLGVTMLPMAALVHLGALVTRGLAAEPVRVPWGNMYEFTLTATFAVVATYLATMRRWSLRWMAPWVTGFAIVVLMADSLWLYEGVTPLRDALQSPWLVIHVVAAIIATGAFVLGGMASGLYLLKERWPDRFTKVPTLEVLDQLAYRMHAFGFPVWTFAALITGPIWAHQAWVLFFIRVSLLRYTNSFLVRSNFMHWISALQVNQRFFVVYFIHYPIGLGCARWLHARDLGLNGLAGNLGLLLVIGLTEIGGIVFGLAARHNRWSSGRQDGQRAT